MQMSPSLLFSRETFGEAASTPRTMHALQVGAKCKLSSHQSLCGDWIHSSCDWDHGWSCRALDMELPLLTLPSLSGNSSSVLQLPSGVEMPVSVSPPSKTPSFHWWSSSTFFPLFHLCLLWSMCGSILTCIVCYSMLSCWSIFVVM